MQQDGQLWRAKVKVSNVLTLLYQYSRYIHLSAGLLATMAHSYSLSLKVFLYMAVETF